jgi:hypothetical protein
VICEGCGVRIIKKEQIKHDSLECEKPLGRCGFCKQVFCLKEMSEHMRLCQLRNVVKVEYDNNTTSPAVVAKGTGPNEAICAESSLAKRKKGAPTAECEFCRERLDVQVD